MAVEIVKVIKETINMSSDSVPVLIEEAPAGKWAEEVYKPDIIEKKHLLYKKPGYSYS